MVSLPLPVDTDMVTGVKVKLLTTMMMIMTMMIMRLVQMIDEEVGLRAEGDVASHQRLNQGHQG